MKYLGTLVLLVACIGCGARSESAARSRPGFVDTTNPSNIPRLPPDANQQPTPGQTR